MVRQVLAKSRFARAVAAVNVDDVVESHQRVIGEPDSKSLVLHDVIVPEHGSVMVSDLFADTPPMTILTPPRREPPSRDGALWPHAARPPRVRFGGSYFLPLVRLFSSR
jgi:hypothetical protein